jgi:hypothetical protein
VSLPPPWNPRREPLGERLTLATGQPIRVHQEDGGWQVDVDYGSYAEGYHRSREEAIEKATTDAARARTGNSQSRTPKKNRLTLAPGSVSDI